MQITVTGRHVDVSDAVRAYCEEKAAKLPRYFDRVSRIEIVLDGDDAHRRVEMIVHSEGTGPFVGVEEHADAMAAVDLLIDKMERQLTRYKERVRNRKHLPDVKHADS